MGAPTPPRSLATPLAARPRAELSLPRLTRSGLLESLEGARAQLAYELRGGQWPGQAVRLAGPEVEAVWVLPLAGGRADGGGGVVDVRVRARGVRVMVAHELVLDAARQASAEGARERCGSLGGEGSAVRRIGGGLGAEHEGAAQLRRDR